MSWETIQLRGLVHNSWLGGNGGQQHICLLWRGEWSWVIKERLALLVHSSPLRSFHCQASGSCSQRPQICHRYLVSLDLVLSWCPVSPVPVSQPACAWCRIIPFAPSASFSYRGRHLPSHEIQSPLVHTYSNKKKRAFHLGADGHRLQPLPS
ncbi:hypothetical protein BGZ61DRAFT_45414 [Ilyonectria robusta]|uniref:uncharacterized protein n=1 Tax=Ilyonectria robusta TaxID=1079257 RepID=UPI001E8E1C1E|nr:uncharacterized protein BGZ61DRAFT_45414 [Ilyonectria robusta]KAH8686771.1 hypothetical protein BGZ61DRAFT_45414 [Ilyonectria robusta]